MINTTHFLVNFLPEFIYVVYLSLCLVMFLITYIPTWSYIMASFIALLNFAFVTFVFIIRNEIESS